MLERKEREDEVMLALLRRPEFDLSFFLGFTSGSGLV